MPSLVRTVFGRLDDLVEVSQCERLILGYSGGLDSSVLLLLTAEYVSSRNLELQAIHVDHGLQDESVEWSKHCVRTAKYCGIRCEVAVLDGRVPAGENTEEWARDERYRLFKSWADRRTCILTAHHADDQAETVFYNAIRGSGPHGLSGIRSTARFGFGYLGRPLIECRRVELLAYARSADIKWLEDPSNRDDRLSRNFIRRRIFPVIQGRFPGAARNLQRLAKVQTDLADVLDRVADSALDRQESPNYRISIAALLEFDRELRPFVLKRWLARAGASIPGRRHIEQILEHLMFVRPDGMPTVCWGHFEVRRYRGQMYLMRRLKDTRNRGSMTWDLACDLRFPWGSLSAHATRGIGINRDILKNMELVVGFRSGGERCHPSFRSHSQMLKKLFQEWSVPPWERDLTPLVFVDGHLAAVGDHCVCQGFAAGPEAHAVKLDWNLNIYENEVDHNG